MFNPMFSLIHSIMQKVACGDSTCQSCYGSRIYEGPRDMFCQYHYIHHEGFQVVAKSYLPRTRLLDAPLSLISCVIDGILRNFSFATYRLMTHDLMALIFSR